MAVGPPKHAHGCRRRTPALVGSESVQTPNSTLKYRRKGTSSSTSSGSAPNAVCRVASRHEHTSSNESTPHRFGLAYEGEGR